MTPTKCCLILPLEERSHEFPVPFRTRKLEGTTNRQWNLPRVRRCSWCRRDARGARSGPGTAPGSAGSGGATASPSSCNYSSVSGSGATWSALKDENQLVKQNHGFFRGKLCFVLPTPWFVTWSRDAKHQNTFCVLETRVNDWLDSKFALQHEGTQLLCARSSWRENILVVLVQLYPPSWRLVAQFEDTQKTFLFCTMPWQLHVLKSHAIPRWNQF